MSVLYLRIALYSLSHGQMDLSLLNDLFKRLWGQDQHLFHLWIPIAPIKEYVFRRNASNDESQSSYLLSPYSFNVLKLEQRLDFKRNCLGKETLKSGEVNLSEPSFASDLYLVWNISLLLAFSIGFIHKISFPHIYCGKRGDKT